MDLAYHLSPHSVEYCSKAVVQQHTLKRQTKMHGVIPCAHAQYVKLRKFYPRAAHTNTISNVS